MLRYDFIVRVTQKSMAFKILFFCIINRQVGFWTAATMRVLGQEKIRMASLSASIVCCCPWKKTITQREESPTDKKLFFFLYSQHPSNQSH